MEEALQEVEGRFEVQKLKIRQAFGLLAGAGGLGGKKLKLLQPPPHRISP